MKASLIIALALVATLISGTSSPSQDRDVLFQSSTIGALFNGVYDGELTYGELKRHGDFGLGTFNGLNGEMIALDGRFYQIKADGKASPVHDSMKTPFSMVTFFETDKTVIVNREINLDNLKGYIDGLIETKNVFIQSRSPVHSSTSRLEAYTGRKNRIGGFPRY